MSLEASVWAWKQTLSATSKLVLLALADGAGHDLETWPSIGRMSSLTGLSRRGVQTQIRRLESLGLVARSERTLSGRQTSNVYRLLVPGYALFGDEKPSSGEYGPPVHQVHTPHESYTQTYTQSYPQGGTTCTAPRSQVHTPPAPGAPESSSESSIESKKDAQARAQAQAPERDAVRENHEPDRRGGQRGIAEILKALGAKLNHSSDSPVPPADGPVEEDGLQEKIRKTDGSQD